MRPFSGPEKLDRTGIILAVRSGCQLRHVYTNLLDFPGLRRSAVSPGPRSPLIEGYAVQSHRRIGLIEGRFGMKNGQSFLHGVEGLTACGERF